MFEEKKWFPLTNASLKELLEEKIESPNETINYLVSELKKVHKFVTETRPKLGQLQEQVNKYERDILLAESRFQTLQLDIKNLWPLPLSEEIVRDTKVIS